MNKSEDIKNVVMEKYAQIAVANQSCSCSCCGTDGGVTLDFDVMKEDYSKLDGYFPDADLGLGCGIPTEYAGIKEGMTILDLGSGAGNDVFVVRRIVGEKGKVIGIDFTDEMIHKARLNCDKLGYNNVEFRKGDIENMPLGANSIDIIVSNCVLNLVPDKEKAFAEMLRVLKPGGSFCVSDIVLKGELPDYLKNVAAWYTGCVAGAAKLDEYLKLIRVASFANISVVKEKEIQIPKDILSKYITIKELESFFASGTKIISVTVKGFKPVIN